ncbi:proline-rich receptor-like protein kinase PERK1 [Carex littledalei]|uniref:non-specific serine/threonine protein kinase n=1 Tax=Carex littledalei TaxID=544730 RepID=A0A833VMG9_9POAL|nr:proline-rich receptor-like protein kinase PERK1 [Carex littledalei]
MAFPKGLISVGDNLVSSAKKILWWCLPMTLFEHAARREEQRGGATIQTFNPMETQRVSIKQSTLTENENVIFGFPKIGFTYEELTVACNGFSDSTFIGRGGFGSVHKGGLDDGREIAIKQLNADSRYGDRDFIAEVDVLSRVHHRHLVQLIGCCITKESKMLVCEYVPNKTLEFHLHKRPESLVDWSTRLTIAIGSAKALSYLHEDCQPRIIHRDIKAANILLENSFEAKVADFGLARFFPDGETHVYATQVVGTRGYLAPEYASTGEIREQSDTYSYGVVLLELITGKTPLIRTNSRVECLVDWARQLLLQALVDHNYHDIVDPRLANNYNSEEMKLMVACASACVRWSPQARPPMSQVVLVLEGIATPDTLGDEPIQSSGDLTSGSRQSMSGYTTTDDTTTDISMNLETEYITAYINSMNQTVSQDERPECVDFPTDEVASSGAMTAVVPRIDATGRDLERSSMDMLLSGENSGYLTKQSMANQGHILNTEYITTEMSSV